LIPIPDRQFSLRFFSFHQHGEETLEVSARLLTGQDYKKKSGISAFPITGIINDFFMKVISLISF